jgi:hypothetical protein
MSMVTKSGLDGKKGTYERILKYDSGIMAEHIMASASVPRTLGLHFSSQRV